MCIAIHALMYGPHAYFVEGLHVNDWKHGIMSTGKELSFSGQLLLYLFTFIFWIALIAFSEWMAGFVRVFLGRHAPWVSAAFRLVGGLALLAFAVWAYMHGAFPIYPLSRYHH